jgi:hypothetical protein
MSHALAPHPSQSSSTVHPLPVHPLTMLNRLRATYGVVGRRRLGHGVYALTFRDGSEETWEFRPETGGFELTAIACAEVARTTKTWADEW